MEDVKKRHQDVRRVMGYIEGVVLSDDCEEIEMA